MQDNYNYKVAERLSINIKACRKKLGYSQQSLSKQSGVSMQNISRIESMRNSPSIEIVNKIAIALETDICLLLARKALSFPGTGKKKVNLIPTLLQEGEASFAFWTRDEGMEYHRISNNGIQNALYMMALLQANGITGKDLLDKGKKLHIPFKV